MVALEGGLRLYPLRFHFEEAGADAKLNQHGPLGVAYHRRHPISPVTVARITAHATVPGTPSTLLLYTQFRFSMLKKKNRVCRGTSNIFCLHLLSYTVIWMYREGSRLSRGISDEFFLHSTYMRVT